jgi:hypothetical protein
MSIQVLSQAAAAMNDNTFLPGGTSMESPSMSPIAGSNSPLLSAIAARNARDLAQLRVLNAYDILSNNSSNSATNNGSSSTAPPSSAAGLLTSVGQQELSPLPPQHRSLSGIVSHLRHAQTQQDHRLDLEALLRSRAADDSLFALQRARAYHRGRFLNSPLTSSLQMQATLFPRSASSTPGTNTSNGSARLALAAAALGADSRLFHQLTAASMARTNQRGVAQSETAHSTKTKAAASVDPSKKTAPSRRALLFMGCDEDSLSEYQCLIRSQMELFEATEAEATCSVQGRNKQIIPGQVGIRCGHCYAGVKGNGKWIGTKGSLYFPTKLDRIYQAAQNLSSFHLCGNCPQVPVDIRNRILVLRERKSPAGGGKRYWAEGVRCLGIVEDQGGLFFSDKKKKTDNETDDTF